MKKFALMALAVFMVGCTSERDTSWQTPRAISACEARGSTVEHIDVYPVGDVLENVIMVHCKDAYFEFINAPGSK